MNYGSRLLIGATLSIFVAFAQPRSSSSKLAPELAGLDPDSSVDVIVKYKEQPTDFHRSLATHRGASQVRSLDIINSQHYRMSASQAAELADDPSVEFVHPDRQVQATATGAQPDYGWVSLLNLPSATSTYTYGGGGIGVAIIDSGINPSVDLANEDSSRIVYSQSFVSGDSSTDDRYGHGTHVAGIVGADGSTSSGGNYVVMGLARSVKLINLRVLDQNGVSTDSAVIAAIQRAIALKSTYNIRVINLSLGRPVTTSYKTDPLCQAVEAAWNAGIVVVVAAGNQGRYSPTSGYGTILSPANDPYVITVGAMNTLATLSRTDDKMASYSSKGPTAIDHIVKPDLVAPGNRVISLLASNSSLASNLITAIISLVNGSNTTTQYLQLSGTSMAAPMVSGTVALMLQQTPSLTPDQVKAKLMLTASKNIPAATCPTGQTCPTQAYKTTTATDPVLGTAYTTYYDIFTIGAGYLDSNKAVTTAITSTSTLSAVSPTATFNSTTGAVTVVNGSSVIWGSSVTWGTSVIWGTSVLSGSSVTWGTSVIWGTNTTSANSVIWGTSVTWGTSAPMGESFVLSLLGEQ